MICGCDAGKATTPAVAVTVTCAWPARSCARMRAGLRSALKTDRSGFLYQNGGVTLRGAIANRKTWVDGSCLRAWFVAGHVGLLRVGLGHGRIGAGGRAHQPDDANGALRELGRSLSGWMICRSGDSWWFDAKVLIEHGQEDTLRWLIHEASFFSALTKCMMKPSHPEMGCMVGALAAAMTNVSMSWDWFLDWTIQELEARSPDRMPTLRTHLVNAAARTGSLSLVERYWAQCERQSAAFANVLEKNNFVFAAVRGGSVDVLEWVEARSVLTDTAPESRAHTTISHARILRCAAAHGHLCLLEHFAAMFTDQGYRAVFMFSHDPLTAAAQAGAMDCVVFLHERMHCRSRSNTAMNEAAYYGHYEVVRYLHEHCGLRCSQSCLWNALKHWSDNSLRICEYLVHNKLCDVNHRSLLAAVGGVQVDPRIAAFLVAHAADEDYDRALAHLQALEHLRAADLLAEARVAAESSS